MKDAERMCVRYVCKFTPIRRLLVDSLRGALVSASLSTAAARAHCLSGRHIDSSSITGVAKAPSAALETASPATAARYITSGRQKDHPGWSLVIRLLDIDMAAAASSAAHGNDVDSPIKAAQTAFWNVNVPEKVHTEECPDFLQYALTNDKDRDVLATPNDQYHRQTWPEVRQIITDNRLDLFERMPGDLRRYREYNAKLVKQHGSVMNFVMSERLQWTDLQPSTSPPFTNPSDYTILCNDWPYGVDERIVHLVVWTKFELAPEPITAAKPHGDLTPKRASK